MKFNNIDAKLKKLSGVYCIRNIINNKIYIGSTKNLYHRISTHYRTLKNNKHINPHLQNAFNTYGIDNFIIEIIDICYNFLAKEQYWIDLYQPYDRNIGYNNSQKVDSCYGYKHTDEAKEKMRLAKLGTKQSPESIQQRSASLKGKTRTDEQKLRMSENRIGDKNPKFGHKEDEFHKKERMKNMLAKPRWNTGLTKETDPRLVKLGFHRLGKLPTNAIQCSIIDLETNEIWQANSMKELSIMCPLSLPTINRLKRGIAGKKVTKRYSFYEN